MRPPTPRASGERKVIIASPGRNANPLPEGATGTGGGGRTAASQLVVGDGPRLASPPPVPVEP